MSGEYPGEVTYGPDWKTLINNLGEDTIDAHIQTMDISDPDFKENLISLELSRKQNVLLEMILHMMAPTPVPGLN